MASGCHVEHCRTFYSSALLYYLSPVHGKALGDRDLAWRMFPMACMEPGAEKFSVVIKSLISGLDWSLCPIPSFNEGEVYGWYWLVTYPWTGDSVLCALPVLMSHESPAAICNVQILVPWLRVSIDSTFLRWSQVMLTSLVCRTHLTVVCPHERRRDTNKILKGKFGKSSCWYRGESINSFFVDTGTNLSYLLNCFFCDAFISPFRTWDNLRVRSEIRY